MSTFSRPRQSDGCHASLAEQTVFFCGITFHPETGMETGPALEITPVPLGPNPSGLAARPGSGETREPQVSIMPIVAWEFSL